MTKTEHLVYPQEKIFLQELEILEEIFPLCHTVLQTPLSTLD